jgi:hypothetical protein
MKAWELVFEQEAERQEAWRAAEFDRCVNTSFDEPPTRLTRRSLLSGAYSLVWYAIHDWNATHPDRALALDCDDLRAACDAGIAGGITTVRRVKVVEVV